MSAISRNVLTQQIHTIANQVYSSETPSAYQLVSFFIKYFQDHNKEHFLDNALLRNAVIVTANADLTRVPKEEFLERLEIVFRSYYPAVYTISEASAATLQSKGCTEEPSHFSKIYELCKRAGLSSSEIAEFLIEITIDGRPFCFIFDSHENTKQRAVIIEIIKSALRKELVTMQEAFIRGTEDRCLIVRLLSGKSDRGFLFGLESAISAARNVLVLSVINSDEKSEFVSAANENALLNSSVCQLANKGNKVAVRILTALQIPEISVERVAQLISEEITLGEWYLFLEELGKLLFRDCPNAVLQSYQVMVRSSLGACFNIDSPSQHQSKAEQFLAEYRKVRDPDYAKMIYSLLPDLPKDKMIVVTLGANHQEGVLRKLKDLEATK